MEENTLVCSSLCVSSIHSSQYSSQVDSCSTMEVDYDEDDNSQEHKMTTTLLYTIDEEERIKKTHAKEKGSEESQNKTNTNKTSQADSVWLETEQNCKTTEDGTSFVQTLAQETQISSSSSPQALDYMDIHSTEREFLKKQKHMYESTSKNMLENYQLMLKTNQTLRNKFLAVWQDVRKYKNLNIKVFFLKDLFHTPARMLDTSIHCLELLKNNYYLEFFKSTLLPWLDECYRLKNILITTIQNNSTDQKGDGVHLLFAVNLFIGEFFHTEGEKNSLCFECYSNIHSNFLIPTRLLKEKASLKKMELDSLSEQERMLFQQEHQNKRSKNLEILQKAKQLAQGNFFENIHIQDSAQLKTLYGKDHETGYRVSRNIEKYRVLCSSPKRLAKLLDPRDQQRALESLVKQVCQSTLFYSIDSCCNHLRLLCYDWSSQNKRLLELQKSFTKQFEYALSLQEKDPIEFEAFLLKKELREAEFKKKFKQIHYVNINHINEFLETLLRKRKETDFNYQLFIKSYFFEEEEEEQGITPLPAL